MKRFLVACVLGAVIMGGFSVSANFLEVNNKEEQKVYGPEEYDGTQKVPMINPKPEKYDGTQKVGIYKLHPQPYKKGDKLTRNFNK